MAVIRARQAGITRIVPHQANRRFIVPSRVKAAGDLQPPPQPAPPAPAPDPEPEPEE